MRSTKAATVRWYSGTGSRNESWPCGEAISRNVTGTRAAVSTRTISRECAVGKRQSVSNESTRKRVRLPRSCSIADATSPSGSK